MSDGNSKARELVRVGNTLFANTERQNRENTWEVLAKHILPFSSGIFNGEDTPGQKKTDDLYDSTGLLANRDLAANFNSTLTNPVVKWTGLRFTNEELNNSPEAVKWLVALNDQIHMKLNDSNFYTEMASAYLNYTAFGNTAIFLEERESDDERFGGYRVTALHLGNLAWAENRDGQVDTVYRKLKMTNRLVAERWPEAMDEDMRMAAERKPYEQRDLMHCVFPRDPKEVKLNSVGLAPPDARPFASYYIDVKTNTLLEEDGFYEFPIFVGRFHKRAGEVYGYGPGDEALPDVRSLSKMRELFLESSALNVRPPIFTKQRNILGQLDLRPRGVNIVRNVQDIVEFTSKTRLDLSQVSLEDLRNSIKSAFFLDKLLLPPRTETGEMTAFEIAQRLEQINRVLGPTVHRLITDVLNPMIIRMAKMLIRTASVPEIPEIIKQLGVDVEIDFVNQLARSQQIQEVNNIQGWFQETLVIAQAKPEVLDLIDGDDIVRKSAKLRGIPESSLLPEEEVQQAREQRAQQQQAAMALEAGVKAADINAKMEGGGTSGLE